MKRSFIFNSIALLCMLVSACTKPELSGGEGAFGSLPSSPLLRSVNLTTDKAAYKPGETVTFTTDRAQKGLGVRYWHLGEVISEEILPESSSWTWTAPAEDFQGYYVQIVGKDNGGNLKTVGSTAVDVSSDWTRFPRYGFLSDFGQRTAAQRNSILENLKNHHINGLQYYDWMYDHHHPLAGTPANPDSEWPSLIGNIWYYDTVKGYIDRAHELGIASMFYDLCYGVLSWAEEDGVGSTWYQYTDTRHNNIDNHPLGAPFRSSIYLVNPSNEGWLNYFSAQVNDVYEAFNFDGFHIDQLGYRGKRYDYNGDAIDLAKGYGVFLNRMKQDEPSRKLAFNAVGGYAQAQIAGAASDFLYTEVWDTNYRDLVNTLNTNRNLGGSKNNVIAGYMNYKQSGKFNTASVLMADALIFAMGGDHLELGEHMLYSEYFPDNKMEMDSKLKAAIPVYYDFLTGYENLLRDNVEDLQLSVSSDDISVCELGPSRGKVNTLVRQKDGKIIIHLLNFSNAAHLDWRDDAKSQVEPEEIENFNISVRSNREVSKAWIASPDYEGGIPQEASFKSSGMKISIKVPALKYWTMIVIE